MGQPKLNFLSDDRLDLLRDRKVTEGLNDLKSSVKDLDINVEVERQPAPALEPTEPRYTKESLSQMARRLYRENIKPVIDEPEAEVKRVPSTYSDRVNGKALAKALIGMRNPDNGDDGSYAPPAGPNGGNMTGPTGTYHALTTSMSLEEYEEYINKKFLSEEEEEVQEVENEPELLQEENPAIAELEDALVEMSDTSWVAIDGVMRTIARENGITPKELHKEFKAKHGMIPDDWAEENQVMEESGWMPLDEAVALNKVGQVYEVTYMYRCVTKRIKFFWPQVSVPTKQEMQDVVSMLYPTAVLVAYYPSTHCGDNKDNFMVLDAPSTPRTVVMRKEDWAPMSDNESFAYETICEEEGEPTSPPILTDDGIELLIEDHDTGEERAVVIQRDYQEPLGEVRPRFMLVGLTEAKGLWDNIHAKRKRGEKPAKPGEKGYPKTLNVEAKNPCWDGYKRKPDTKKFDKGSCVKESGYEDTKRGEVIDALKKKKGDFVKRYGKDAPDVMYAVADKTAKRKGDTSKSDDRYAYEEYIPEDSRRISNKQHTQRVRSNIKAFGDNYTPPNNWDPDANRGK